MTWAEPTLFFGRSASAAAYEVPPRPTKSASIAKWCWQIYLVIRFMMCPSLFDFPRPACMMFGRLEGVKGPGTGARGHAAVAPAFIRLELVEGETFRSVLAFKRYR